MPRPNISIDDCTGCGICVDTCTDQVLDIVDDYASVTDEDACTGCGDCAEECPTGAIQDIEDDE